MAIRFIWSMLSFGSGFPGGIFLPILTLGALSGSVFAAAFENLGFLHPVQFPIFIILGMAGYFGAVSKAPLTAMILVTEMVGDLHPVSYTHLDVYKRQAFVFLDMPMLVNFN